MNEVERSECSVASTSIELAPSCQSKGEMFRRDSSLSLSGEGMLPEAEAEEPGPGNRRGTRGEVVGNTLLTGEAGTEVGGAGNLWENR